MSEASDGTGTGPVGEPVPQTARPPVPGAGPPDEPGRHRTEQVPFPLPPLPAVTAGPAAVGGPATGQLDLGGYPPKVPGGRRPPAVPEDDDDR